MIALPFFHLHWVIRHVIETFLEGLLTWCSCLSPVLLFKQKVHCNYDAVELALK
jgi:hypothetical protein